MYDVYLIYYLIYYAFFSLIHVFCLFPFFCDDHFDIDLQVLPADIVTRVSEYVPQIVDYVKKIIDNGFAYESCGSVYFDVGKFDAEPNHYYAKVKNNF